MIILKTGAATQELLRHKNAFIILTHVALGKTVFRASDFNLSKYDFRKAKMALQRMNLVEFSDDYVVDSSDRKKGRVTTAKLLNEDVFSVSNKKQKEKVSKLVKDMVNDNIEDVETRLAVVMYKKFYEFKPKSHTLRTARINNWVSDINTIKLRYKEPYKSIYTNFIKAMEDEFWQNVIQSPSGLLKHYDKIMGIRKSENAVLTTRKQL